MSSWAVRVYEVDKRSAEICRDMTISGFAFDPARAAQLSELLQVREAEARDACDSAVGRPIARTDSGGFKTDDLHAAFFRDLGAPVYFRSQLTGRPSLGVDSMRAYAACADPRLRKLALSILDWRRARKIRSTYIDRIVVGSDGRVHPSWLNYGTVSGRWSCQGPNLMNLPRRGTDPTRDLGGVRSLYVAPPGCSLVYFDAKQLEMRIAAYASGDEAMIHACESGDLHGTNAIAIFEDAFNLQRYETLSRMDQSTMSAEQLAEWTELYTLRTMAKTSGFAVCYMAEAKTVFARLVADGQQVKLRQVEAMLRRMRRSFASYYRWQDRRLMACVRRGWTDSPLLGRRRWLGHDPSPTECANFPIQGGAADLMNYRVDHIVATLRERHPKARIVAQVHDSVTIEVPQEEAEAVGAICKQLFEAPATFTTSGKPLEASFPIDLEIIDRWH